MEPIFEIDSSIATRPTDYIDGLIELLQKFSKLAESTGLNIQPYSTAALQKFKSYPPHNQKIIYDSLAIYCSVIIDIINQGVPFYNNRQSLWKTFKRLGVFPNSDLMSTIDEKDVIEIYLPNNTQCFRNWHYFQYTSYTIGDLITFTWPELFEHQMSDEYSKIAERIFKGEQKDPVYFDVAPYLAKEKFSSQKLSVHIRPKVIAPLVHKDTRRNEGLIVAWEIKIVGREAS